MKTAEQILENKGYDLDEISDIICFKTKYSEEGLDMKVRTEFGIEEPVHLWESYAIGDADESIMEVKAKENNCDSIKTLLRVMDARLIELCEKVERKINIDSSENELMQDRQ